MELVEITCLLQIAIAIARSPAVSVNVTPLTTFKKMTCNIRVEIKSSIRKTTSYYMTIIETLRRSIDFALINEERIISTPLTSRVRKFKMGRKKGELSTHTFL